MADGEQHRISKSKNIGRRAVRVSRPEDWSSIQKIFTEAGLTVSAAAPADLPPDTIPRFHVCEVDAEIVAAIHWRSVAPEAEILDIAVKTAQRRRGHASLLLEHFLEHAASLGLQKIFLEVRESNIPAIALYKKFGFVSLRGRPNYYRNPDEAALLFQLSLAG